MLKRITLSFIFIFLFAKSFAQQTADTILVYDLSTQLIDTILPIAIDTSIQSDGSSSFVGSMGNKIPLSLTPPTANLFSGSNFSKLARANSFFNLRDYPMRTAVALHSYTNGIEIKSCSGMIVSSNFVMTLGFCVFTPYNKTFFFDSLKVYPAFDNAAPQPNLPVSFVKKIYIFKSFYDNGVHDVALLELKDPIGLQTGWTGIGFNKSPNFILNNVFHKFSYPSDTSIANPNLIYNGDTLYYNYGKIEGNNGSPYYLINSPEAYAVRGQGGSTFMYTDNNNQYLNVGISEYSTAYIHYKITNAAFYQLQNVMQNNFATAVKENKASEINLRLYPNPLNDQAVLEFDYKAGEKYALKITDALGQIVEDAIPVNGGRVVIQRKSLQSGIYILQLSNNKFLYTIKMVIE